MQPWHMLAALITLGAPMAANAAVLTNNFAGTIAGASTIDRHGYFGPAGGDLAGQAVTIYTQYVTRLLPTAGVCRTSPLCTFDYAYASTTTNMAGADIAGSVLITITINGHRVVYSPSYFGQTLFDNNAEHYLYWYADAGSFGLGLPGAEVEVGFPGTVSFGAPAPKPIVNAAGDFMAFFTASDTVPSETLTFTLSAGGR